VTQCVAPKNIRPYRAPNRSVNTAASVQQVGKADESVCNDETPLGNFVSQFDAERLDNSYDDEMSYVKSLRMSGSDGFGQKMSELNEKLRLGMSTEDCDRKILLEDEPYPSREEFLKLLIYSKNPNLNDNIIPIDFYDSEYTRKLWEVLYDIRTCYILSGFRVVWRPILLRSLIALIKELFELDKTGVKWIKLVKFKLGFFAAFIKSNNVFPKSPFPDNFRFSAYPLIDKKITSYHKQLNKYKKFKHMILIDSICRGVKKGAPRPSRLDLDNNIRDTFNLFTQKKVHEEIINCSLPHFRLGDEFEYDNLVKGFNLSTNYDFTSDRLLLEIRRTVNEVFTRLREPLDLNHFPSTSSCVENTTKDGGSNLIIYNLLREYYGDVKTDHIIIRKKENILNNYDYPSWKKPEDYDKYMKSQEFIEIDFGSVPLMSDVEIEQLAQFALTEEPEIILLALAEALKTRGISKGNALENYLLKSIQKQLAKQLLNTNCFAPTKGDLTEDMINTMFSQMPLLQKFLSGDYDNATNEIYGEFSKFTISCIMDRTGITDDYPNMSRLAKRSLLNNNVTGFISKNEILEGVQIDGQPMGKVLSFVTLCVINASMCRYVCELDQRKNINMKDFKAYINGDDCCFPLDNFELWEQCLRCVGLKNSVGKTFYTDEFIEMNSRTFLKINKDTDIYNNFKMVPFVNFGLLKCLQRSSEQVTELSFQQFVSTCGPIHTEFVADFKSEDNNLYIPLTDLFINKHKKHLHDPRLSGISWFLPRWLTGLGLDINKEDQLTLYDKVIAGRLYSNYDNVNISHYNNDPEWEIHSLVNNTMKEICGTKPFIKYKDVITHIPDFNCDEDPKYNIIDLKENQQSIYNKLIQIHFRNCTDHNSIYLGHVTKLGCEITDLQKKKKKNKEEKTLRKIFTHCIL